MRRRRVGKLWCAAALVAGLVLRIGEGLETFLETPLKSLAGTARLVEVMALEGVELRAYRDGATWEANGKALVGRTAALAREIDDLLAPVKGRPYVVFHDAYQHFEERLVRSPGCCSGGESASIGRLPATSGVSMRLLSVNSEIRRSSYGDGRAARSG